MVIRKHARYAVTWAVTFVHAGIRYEGTVSNVSLKGCVLRANVQAFTGMHLHRMSMDPQDGQSPLLIEKASVRWQGRDSIGLEFTKISEPDQVRLGSIIQTFEDALPKRPPLKIPTVTLAAATGHKADKQTVLIVDDEEAILGISAEILERAGFQVLKAKDSAQALQICTTHKGGIDLLLTDLVLVPRGFRLATPDNPFPQVHGHELALRAVAIRPDLKIAFMSGNPDEDLAAYGIKRGAFSFLSKPFSMDAVIGFVKEALKNTDGAMSTV